MKLAAKNSNGKKISQTSASAMIVKMQKCWGSRFSQTQKLRLQNIYVNRLQLMQKARTESTIMIHHLNIQNDRYKSLDLSS